MNVRKLLARLNPGTMNLRGGGAGGPDLSPEDIAGALGFVPAGLGREVLCFLWWPLGASLKPAQLMREVALIQAREHARLAAALRNATDRLVDLELVYYSSRLAPPELRGEIQRAARDRDAAREQSWSYQPEVYANISRAVLAEMAGTTLCPACKGDGCAHCDGTGAIAISARQRAEAIGRDEAAFRKRWARVYDFTYRRLRDAEQQAARTMARALRDDVGVAA
jgi:hypothetical protein